MLERRHILLGAALLLAASWADAYIIHKVQKGETLFGIAHNYGVEVDEILELNPEAEKGLKKNMKLRIPETIARGQDTATAEAAQTTGEDADEAKTVPVSAADSVQLSVAAAGDPNLDRGHDREHDLHSIFGLFGHDGDEDARQNVLLALPFMSQSASPNRAAALCADFYRGFLLELEREGECRYPLNIIADDTGSDTATYDILLENARLSHVGMVIAPDNADMLAAANAYGEVEHVYVLNLLNVKDDSYLTNPYAIQCNIPQQLMYDKAIEAMLDLYAGYTPVIISPSGARAEKEGFISALRHTCADKGIEVVDIQCGTTLQPADLEGLSTSGRYVFIPKSGSANVFNKFAAVLSDFRLKFQSQDDVALFGYPDWIAFKGDNKRALHALGAVYYSRVCADATSQAVADVKAAYTRWYGGSSMEAVPDQSLLGYDAAGLVREILSHGTLEHLGNERTIRYNGLQSAFNLRRVHGGGYVNTALYIITCGPDGISSCQIR